MTTEQLRKLAHDAGFFVGTRPVFLGGDRLGDEPVMFHAQGGKPFEECLTKFAELVAAAEREACAKVCERYSEEKRKTKRQTVEHFMRTDAGLMALAAENLTLAIRARGENEPT